MTDASDKRAKEENRQLRLKLFGEYRNEQLTRERANSDKYDNTILTYSAGALALSLTFIKDVAPLATAQVVWVLKVSWVLFVLALLVMLASFPIAQAENRKSVDFAHKYYIDEEEAYCNKVGWQGRLLRWLNILAGTVFFLAIVLTTTFVWINVQEHLAMTDKSDKKITTTTTTTITTTAAFAMDGTPSAKPVPMPMTYLQGGTPAAKMQTVSTKPPAPTSTSSAPPPKSGK